MEVKPKRPRFNSRRGSQAQLVRAPDYVRHFQNVRHLQWRSSLSSAMSILWYYKLEYSTNVSEAEESNRQQANLPLHSQSRESTTLFSPAIQQAIDRSLQSGNIYTLLTSINHPTAYIGMLVSQCHEPSDSSHVYARHSLPTRSNSPTACMYVPFNICRLHLKVLFMNNAKAIWHRSLMHIAMITEL